MIINTYFTNTRKKDSYKAFVISDLHYSSKKDDKKLATILKIIKTNQYDGIFIVGDILDFTNILKKEYQESKNLYLFFKELGSITPTYITSGNHDVGYYDANSKEKWLNDEKTFKSKFINKISCFSGIKILTNETIKLNKQGYTLSSIILPLEYVPLLKNNTHEVLEKIKDNLAYLKNLDPNDENILLCHYPEVILGLKDSTELNNVHLSIAGHTHSGVTQVFPLELLLNMINQKNRGLITPYKTLFLTSNEATKYLRGTVNLSDESSLLINPAITTLSSVAGPISHLDFCFYSAASEIIINENSKRKTVLTKKYSRRINVRGH